MSLKYIFVASAVLIALSAADVSHLKADKIDLPFNDLLPPLLEESSTTTTTTTTTTPKPKPITTTVATKPTKKSYYQKPAQEKAKPIVAKEDVQQLSLDLLPPFEDEKPAEEKTQQAVKSEPNPVVKPTPKPVVQAPAKPVVPIAPKPVVHITPKPVVQATSRPLVHATPRPVVQVAPQQPQYSVHPAPHVALPVQSSPSKSGFQSRFSNYFLTSTVRPRRGPLPTITPFPHFVRL